MEGYEKLRASVAGVRIVHHLKGRIRLKLGALPAGFPAPDAADLERFQALLGDIEGVRSLRVNLLARSCTVEYDPLLIPDEAWRDFLGGTRSGAAGVLENILRRKYREAIDGRS